MKKKRVLMSAVDVGRWRHRDWHFRSGRRGRHENDLICVFLRCEDKGILPLVPQDVIKKMNIVQIIDVMTGGFGDVTCRLLKPLPTLSRWETLEKFGRAKIRLKKSRKTTKTAIVAAIAATGAAVAAGAARAAADGDAAAGAAAAGEFS